MQSQVERFVWVDLAKTIAIVLVVFGHVWRGLHQAEMLSSEMFRVWDNAIYYFHMPLFFMISGFLFYRGHGRDWKHFIRRQWVSIIWPYILWSIIIVSIKAVLSSSVNSGGDMTDLLRIAYEPVSIFWFLYVLFISQVLVKVVFEKIQSIYLLLGIGVVLLLIGFIFDLSQLGALENVSKFMLFFIIGFVCANKDILKEIKVKALYAFFAFILFLIGEFILLYLGIELDHILTPLAGGVLSVCVIVVCIWLSQKNLSKSPVFLYISLGTLAIYVAHVICTAGARIVLTKLGVDDISIHVVVGTTLGLVCPLIMYEISRYLKISPWVGLGRLL